MTSARFAPAARRDLVAVVVWIAKDNPSAARALQDTVLRAAVHLGDHPQLGALRNDLVLGKVFRMLPLTGFPYVIVYTDAQHPPMILRILHGARDLPDILGNL